MKQIVGYELDWVNMRRLQVGKAKIKGSHIEKSSKSVGNSKVTNAKAKCPKSNKVRYRDIQEAKQALRRAKGAARVELELYGQTKRAERRIYFCAPCRGYHTTSRDEISNANWVKAAA